MKSSIAELQSHFYPQEKGRDAVAIFVAQLQSRLRPEDVVADVGAGAGERNVYAIKGKVRKMYGIDLDPRVRGNPLLDEGYVTDGKTLPLADGSVDMAFSIYVHEHLENPASFAAEIFRVLRPGGSYLALTPNRFHYVPLIAAMTPTSFHRWLNRRRGREGEDTFPTYYRLNTATAIKRCFHTAGFDRTAITAIEVEPQYLKFHLAAYLAGVAYERVVNASVWLSALRVNLIADCGKPQ